MTKDVWKTARFSLRALLLIWLAALTISLIWLFLRSPSACPCVSFRGSFAAYRHGCECKKFLPTLCLVCLAPQNEHPVAPQNRVCAGVCERGVLRVSPQE